MALCKLLTNLGIICTAWMRRAGRWLTYPKRQRAPPLPTLFVSKSCLNLKELLMNKQLPLQVRTQTHIPAPTDHPHLPTPDAHPYPHPLITCTSSKKQQPCPASLSSNPPSSIPADDHRLPFDVPPLSILHTAATRPPAHTRDSYSGPYCRRRRQQTHKHCHFPSPPLPRGYSQSIQGRESPRGNLYPQLVGPISDDQHQGFCPRRADFSLPRVRPI